jgi:ATP-binding cassette, subfamily B, bacterial
MINMLQPFRKAWRDRFAALKNIPPAIRLLWESSPKLVATATGLRVFVALLPLTALWIGKLIINLVVSAREHPGPVPAEIWFLLAAEFVVAGLAAVLGRAIDYCDGRLADNFSRSVSVRVMRHAATLDLESFEDPEFYNKLERARVQANDRIGMLHALGQLLQQSITLISLSLGVLVYSPLLFFLMAAAVLPAFFGETHFALLGYALAYSLTPLRRELDYLRDLGTKKESVKELKIFGLGGYLCDRFSAINDEVIGRNRRLATRRLRISALLAILGALGYYATYAILVVRTLHGSLSIGALTFLAGALAGCSSQIQAVFSTFTGIADQALFLTDLFHFFAMQPRIRGRAAAIPAPRPIRDGFEFRDVSFAYPQTQRNVIDRLNLRIDAGERIAIVGENGQGKTTLIKLLTRLYEPTSGRILLDGVDLREYDLDDLHREIGVIFQDYMRYDLTARENIAVGRIELRDSDSLLLQAARQSGAIEPLNRLPHGLDHMLGRRFDEGLDLSGGEWQKFAMARAYIRDAQVLILDEPTASLDAISEYETFRHFAELTAGKTSILISHRFSTVRMSDRIVVLEQGAVREEGSHQQLLARGGRYASMFELQAATYR